MLQWESGGKIWCLDSSSSAQRVGYLHSKLRSLLVQGSLSQLSKVKESNPVIRWK